MGLFKRKKAQEQREDFSKYKIKITGKVMCAYEVLTGKPFLKISDEDDIKHLFYCSLVLNNEEFSTMEYEVFEYLIADPGVLEWMSGEYMKIGRFLTQFRQNIFEEKSEGEAAEDDEEKTFYMVEAISGLIVKMGLDPDYVMYRMEEWEISYYYHMMRDMERERLTEERLWTYLQVLPHVGKKLGGPEKLLPFPWETEKKKNKLMENSGAAFAFLTKQNEKQLDNNTESEGTGGGQ